MLTLIRPAKPEDCDHIVSLMTSVIRETVATPYQVDTIVNVAGNVEYWSNNLPNCVHLVAELESEIVGVILIKEFWNLCSHFVDVQHHRKGIGRALTQEAIESCRGKSPKGAILLNSSPFAVRFYTAFGFVPRDTNQRLPAGVEAMRYDLLSVRA